MSNPTAGPSSNPATGPALTSLRESLDLAARIAGAFTSVRTRSTLNQVEHTGTAPLNAVDTADLLDLIGRGHVVQVHVRLTSWSVTLRRGDGDVTDAEGNVAEAVDQPFIGDLEAALLAREFKDVLNLLQAHDATITVRVTNDPSATGTHWIADHASFVAEAASAQWVPFARNLASGPAALLVDDLDDVVLTNLALTVHGQAGQAGQAGPSRRDAVAAADEPFRDARAATRAVGQTPLPSPVVFASMRRTSGADSPACAAMRDAVEDLGYLLAWSLLANTAEPVAGGVHITVSGARELDVTVTAGQPGQQAQSGQPGQPAQPAAGRDTTALLEMYKWVATSPEIDRLYFVQQAVTLAVVMPTDVPTAAAPAFRTARSLYDLSRQSSVAEVMSARRSAREMALAASRSAAGVAREAAGKAVERTLVQIAGAAGIAVVRFQNALPDAVTTWLLVLIAAVCLASALITDRVTLTSATNGLDSELADLDRYRDSLSAADIDDVKGIGAVSAARSDITNARITSGVTYGVAIAAIIVALIFVPDAKGEAKDEPSEPAPSSQAPSGSASDPAPSSAPSQTPTSPTASPVPTSP